MSQALTGVGWGPNPWLRYRRALTIVGVAILGPLLMLNRIAAVTHYHWERDAWPVILSLSVSDWLSVLLGSLTAWYPWSLAMALVLFGGWAVWASVPFFYLVFVESWRGRPLMLATYRQGGWLLAIVAPLLVVGLGFYAVPKGFELVVIGVCVGAAFTALAGIRVERRPRFPRLLRPASVLIFAWMLAIAVASVFVIVSGTPWVPRQCLRVGAATFRGYVLSEAATQTLVLRDGDRRVVAAPPGQISVAGRCRR